MAQMKIETRIKKEKKRLNEIYKDLPEKKKAIAEGVIDRASFMRVKMEDLEEHFKVHGLTEDFQQSERVAPYKRKTPEADLYIQLSTQYTKITTLLDGMLPKVKEQPITEEDVFDDFVESREDV